MNNEDYLYKSLIATILSNDIKIPENARICACYILKSYTKHDVTLLNNLEKVVLEGAENNFSLPSVAKTNNRAYFVDLRAHVLSLLIENFDKNSPAEVQQMFRVILTCFNDYKRNNKGDIGSRLRIAAMKSIQVLSGLLSLDCISDWSSKR